MAEVSGKSFLPESLPGYTADIAGQLGLLWELIRVPLIAPLLRVCVYICLAMSIMVFMERLYMGVVIVLVKLFWKKPEKRYRWEAMKDDLEMGSAAFPMVYKISIGAACNLSWPADRLVIQVLDDSTDFVIKDMVEKECIRWASKGINIRYQIRETRGGYKAGALKEGLKHDYVKECEYVVIFDADFDPNPISSDGPFRFSFTTQILLSSKLVGVNSDECLLTRMQEMSLDYHFTVEQEVGSATHAFFGFNGTGGIWRIAAINEAGGWKDRTTVEDMDLAVRAGLKGWKFVYLGDLQVKSELPSTFKAFRFQQHRWSCGPANLFRKMVMDIATNKKVSLYKKFYVIYSFFFVRKLIAHMFTFFFYCVVLPLSILVPEVDVPKWGAIYIPCIITTLNSVGTPRSFHLLFYWVLFENVMSFTGPGVHRSAGGQEEKKRYKNKSHSKSAAPRKSLTKFFGDRIQLQELGFALFLFICGCYDFLYGKNNYFIYLFLQVITFTIAGFGYIGTIVPSS
ncbi:UNVERIFIED_CONTAM: Glucomannan 4-beta-mannosyltransferase 2 [Sesamum angustifolium]|uniref:glucomannan 4-beta-mannosyltransferase n=1 Tax=Sesamum angustifolium TaxID=2727405 RepID=A0AAW2QQU0_9LAMI